MKIGIDARICSERGLYPQFVRELIQAFIEVHTQHEIVIYGDIKLFLFPDAAHEKSKIIEIVGKRTSFMQRYTGKNIFEKENFGLMLFFDHHIPRKYSGEYMILIESLKEVFFPKKQFIHRKFYSFLLKQALKSAKKALVFDTESAMQLNEKLNIHEDCIEQIDGFFPKYTASSVSPVKLNISSKYNLRGEYIIYDSGNELHNNFERILKTLKTLKDQGIILYLLVLCEETTKDVDIRSKVLEYDISSQILFLGEIPKEDEYYYYSQSVGVIFSSIYESFPFHFQKALHYNAPIFANNIPANKNVMGEYIHYLDPLSIHNICDTLTKSIASSKQCDYNKIAFSPQNSALRLKEIIEEKG